MNVLNMFENDPFKITDVTAPIEQWQEINSSCDFIICLVYWQIFLTQWMAVMTIARNAIYI